MKYDGFTPVAWHILSTLLDFYELPSLQKGYVCAACVGEVTVRTDYKNLIGIIYRRITLVTNPLDSS